jgi:hypothetical protein
MRQKAYAIKVCTLSISLLLSSITGWHHNFLCYHFAELGRYLRRKSHESMGTIHCKAESEEGRTKGYRRQKTARSHGSPSQSETGIGT